MADRDHRRAVAAVTALPTRYGETNASVPKDVSVDELTHGQALAILAERAAQGPPKKKPRRKAAAPKAAKAAKTTKKPKKAAKKKSAT